MELESVHPGGQDGEFLLIDLLDEVVMGLHVLVQGQQPFVDEGDVADGCEVLSVLGDHVEVEPDQVIERKGRRTSALLQLEVEEIIESEGEKELVGSICDDRLVLAVGQKLQGDLQQQVSRLKEGGFGLVVGEVVESRPFA